MSQLTYKLSSERAIENLIAQYSHFLDAGDFDGVGRLFKYGKITFEGSEEEGSENVKRHLEKNLNIHSDGTIQKAHITSNTIMHISSDENTATASSYVTIFQQDKEKGFPLQPTIIGRYNDNFARKDGEWHFKVRNLTLKIIGDISHHTINSNL